MTEATVAGVRTAPLVWSVRRELWEHRSIYLAPAAVAALMVLGGFINTDRLRDKLGKISLLPAADQSLALATPFEIVAAGLFVTGLIVAVIYCMDALYAERRDRSVLFWKSLPVSDATAVAAKMLVPLLVIPAVLSVAIVRLRTVADRESVTARTLLGSRTVPWDDIDGLRFAKSAWARARLNGGSEMQLPAVTFATLPLLTAASGGRVPNPYE